MTQSTNRTLELPKPHSREQRIIMQAFATPGLQEIWCPCGTKFGKSLGWSASMASVAWVKKNQLYRWVAPVYKQAKIGMSYHKNLFPHDAVNINKSDLSITLPLGSRIEYTSGKFPEDLEGAGVTGGYCFDEAAKMPRAVYESASTTVTVTRALMAFFSTPKGKGWFYDGYTEAKAHMEWSLAKGIAPTKIAITAPTAANPHVPRESIEDARKRLPDRLFRQFYLAEFMDSGSVFVGFRECVYGEQIDFHTAIEMFVDSEVDTASVVIGADWAKKEDFTVFTAIDYNYEIPKVVGYCRFQGLSYIEAIRQLIIFSRKFKQIRVVYHDKTGVGEAIDDMLGQTSLPFEGVVFTNASKSSMVSDLMLCFERGDILIPNIPDLIYELDVFEVVTNSLGTARYSAPSGMHDDIVCSLMLAYSACKEYRADFKVRFVEDLPNEKFTVERWYTDLADED